jgi:uncharacterized membrane protein
VSAPIQRRWELDVLRGAAVIGMVFYHALYDAAAAGLTAQDPLSDGWRLFARGVLMLFLLVSGASDALSAARAPDRATRWRKALKRAAILGAAALLVTVATRTGAGEFYVRFGVLHCLAVAALILPLLDRWGPLAHLAFAAVLGAISWPFAQMTGSVWLLPLGLPQPGFMTMDYVPLLPWVGVIAIGQGAGRWLQGPPPSTLWPELKPLAAVGRRALPIYLLHQPVIIPLCWLLAGWGK